MVHFIASFLIASSLTPTTTQARVIERLEDKLMAPCCYSQTIRLHMSAEAEQMREEVTSMVMAGKSEQEIVSYYKAKYGETILVVPDGISGEIAYAVPVCVFLFGSTLLMFVIKRSLQRQSALGEAAPYLCKAAIGADVVERIRRELGDGV